MESEDIVEKLGRLALVAQMLMPREDVLEMLHEARIEIRDLRAKLSSLEVSSWEKEQQKRRLEAFKAAYGERLKDRHTEASLIALHKELYSRGITAWHREYWDRAWEKMGGRFEEV